MLQADTFELQAVNASKLNVLRSGNNLSESEAKEFITKELSVLINESTVGKDIHSLYKEVGSIICTAYEKLGRNLIEHNLKNENYGELINLAKHSMSVIKPHSQIPENNLWSTVNKSGLPTAIKQLEIMQKNETKLDQLSKDLIAKIPQWKAEGKLIVVDVDDTALNDSIQHFVSPTEVLKNFHMAHGLNFNENILEPYKANRLTPRPQIKALLEAFDQAELSYLFLTMRPTNTNKTTEAQLKAAGFMGEGSACLKLEHVLAEDKLDGTFHKLVAIKRLIEKGILPSPNSLVCLDDKKEFYDRDDWHDVFGETVPKDYFYQIPTKPHLGIPSSGIGIF